MRLQFQRVPWDLYWTVTYTIVITAVLEALNVGNFFSILLVVFAPGYVLVAVLFPANKDLDWVERIAFSVGLSIAVTPLLGLLLNLASIGIRLRSIVGSIALLTVLAALAAWWRRMQLTPTHRLSGALELPSRNQYSRREKTVTILLVSSIIVAGGALGGVVLTARPGGHFTEFYMLGPSGNASGYPTVLNVSQPGSVLLGIANHEAASVFYTVRIDLIAVRLVYNATSGYNETVEVNRTTSAVFNVTLDDGHSWINSYTFRIKFTGPWKIQFLLFKDGDFSSRYRELHLFVRVQ